MTRSFAVPEPPGQSAPALEWDELLGYLRAIDDFNLPPLDALLAQTDVVGDPAMPKPAECAVLRWIERVFQEWEQSFPLEWELTHKLRAFKPAVAMASLSEETFFRPGQHPLHQMLDAIHSAAIGWQGDLGRIGQPVTNLIDKAIADVRGCLDQGGDMAAIASQIVAEAQRMRARAEKLTERTIAAEHGRLRAAMAKTIAADLINGQLLKYTAPSELNAFIRGPWYDSAQLTYLKFGDQSQQWRDFEATTGQLLLAMHPLAPPGTMPARNGFDWHAFCPQNCVDYCSAFSMRTIYCSAKWQPTSTCCSASPRIVPGTFPPTDSRLGPARRSHSQNDSGRRSRPMV
ncbi:DUF1631 family protein [Halioglobus japonicus]|uniref:DUF1631 family protein n=1 Tax=Halioglobus japonicus TaxID=930805 RepID=UPI0012F4EECF|nr:DUF1631 family protein [Halioglobus japonicus]